LGTQIIITAIAHDLDIILPKDLLLTKDGCNEYALTHNTLLQHTWSASPITLDLMDTKSGETGQFKRQKQRIQYPQDEWNLPQRMQRTKKNSSSSSSSSHKGVWNIKYHKHLSISM
jgi:hypothetical protein